jgi:hypothetical protein
MPDGKFPHDPRHPRTVNGVTKPNDFLRIYQPDKICLFFDRVAYGVYVSAKLLGNVLLVARPVKIKHDHFFITASQKILLSMSVMAAFDIRLFL